MKRATWRGAVIAEAEEIQVVDGYSYFPRDAVKWELMREATRTSVCSWKGTARYWDVVVGDEVNAAAAWSYETPKPAAERLTGWIGFWHGVDVA